jgi:hypothetical protein
LSLAFHNYLRAAAAAAAAFFCLNISYLNYGICGFTV